MSACERCGAVYARTGLSFDDEGQPFICDSCKSKVKDALTDALVALDQAVVYLDAAGLPRLVNVVRKLMAKILE